MAAITTNEPLLIFYWVSAMIFVLLNTVSLAYVLIKNKCKFNAIFKSAFAIYFIIFFMRGISTSLLYFDLILQKFDNKKFSPTSPFLLALGKEESILIIALYLLAVLKMQ